MTKEGPGGLGELQSTGHLSELTEQGSDPLFALGETLLRERLITSTRCSRLSEGIVIIEAGVDSGPSVVN